MRFKGGNLLGYALFILILHLHGKYYYKYYDVIMLQVSDV